jgi:hypothetical protein
MFLYRMGKKCIPGVLCVENMTLFILMMIFIFIVYIVIQNQRTSSNTVVIQQPSPAVNTMVVARRRDDMENPYAPPLKMPIVHDYSQIGILTRGDQILPLMGRQHPNGRDKWQYYTISNTGTLNTKLPLTVKGKSGMSEYGCDQVYNGDRIFVDGYKDVFDTTIYENNMFRYVV